MIMELDGDSIVLTRNGRKIWENLSDEKKKHYVNCMSMILEGCCDTCVSTSDLVHSRLDDIYNGIKEGMVSEALKNQIDELKYYLRSSDVSSQISEIRMMIEKGMKKSSQEKGKDGEKFVIDSLQSQLRTSDGYSIEDVSGVSNNCDILVKKLGHCDVRIDVKNWSGNVSQRDVEKFERDLTTLDSSGILVSLSSGVVGKRQFEMTQLMTGKFALYLCDFGESISSIPQFIDLIHSLEDICNSGTDTIRIDKLAFTRVEMYLQENMNRVTKLKQTLRTAMSIVSEIDYEKISDIIKMVDVNKKIPEDLPNSSTVHMVECPICKVSFKSKAGMVSHKKHCLGPPPITNITVKDVNPHGGS